MVNYLVKMKTTVDTFSSIGHNISEEDKILYILGGFRYDYDAFVVFVIT